MSMYFHELMEVNCWNLNRNSLVIIIVKIGNNNDNQLIMPTMKMNYICIQSPSTVAGTCWIFSKW